MTKKEKLLNKFLNHPEALRYSELCLVLSALGFEEIRAKGSHVKWKHPLLGQDLIFPIHNHDCKDFYKKQALKILKTHKLL